MSALERRIKAAQALAGYDSLDDLAAAIGRESEGLSRKTLRRIASENDPRRAKDYELAWIAEACEIPLSFLTEGAMPPPEQPTQEQLERLETTLREVASQASEERQAIMELLAQQDEILRKLTRVAEGLPDDDALRMWNEGTQDVLAAAEALQARRSAAAAGRGETPRRREASG